MPAYMGAATDELIPGTTSNSMPSATRASASSPPLSENEGVAAFEPHHFAAFLSFLDDEFCDFVLWYLVESSAFAHENPFSFVRR